jgi:iron complex outermembrane receptor protein
MKRRILKASLKSPLLVTAISLIILGLASSNGANAQDISAQPDTEKKTETGKDTKKTEVVVKGEKDSNASATKKTVKKSTIDIQGGAAQISPYWAISTVPGVDIRAQDPSGLNVTHRIRGKSNRNIGETLDGMPLKGIGPGVGLGTMVDMENIDSITVSKGAISADSGLGWGTDNGMVDMHMKQSSDDLHATAKQVVGNDMFSRTFARVDTGNLFNIAKIFASGSYSTADKWKGEGKSPDGRKNFAVGISGTANQPVEWDLTGIYNEDNQHSYKGISYTQTHHLSKYYDQDYNKKLTGTPATDSSYYDYNRQHFITYAVFGRLKTPMPLAESSLTIKPYYCRDHGYSYSGSGTTVTDWLVDHQSYGSTIEYSQKILQAQVKAGYWYGETDPPGPPTTQKTRNITAGTGALTFASWSKLIKPTTTNFSSPYITGERAFGPFTVNVGLRYLALTTTDLTSYVTSGIGDVCASDAYDQATTEKYHVDGRTWYLYLPNIGGTCQVSDFLSFKLNYGRNYDTPQYSLGSQLDKLYSTGKTQAQLQSIWSHKMRPQVSDDVDLGMNLILGKLNIEPTLFYSYVRDGSASVYDASLNASYYQNCLTAQSYGVEMGVGYDILDNLNVIMSVMYNNYRILKDVQTASATTVDCKGNQMPDVPEFMGNLTANWKIWNITVSPTARYMGERYIDAENEYKLSPYFLMDLALSWKIIGSDSRNIILTASVMNILNEKYIATSNGDTSTTGSNMTTFNVGPERTFFAGLQATL